jgi:hypothetical protein
VSWNDEDYRRAFQEGHTRNLFVAGLLLSWGVWVKCPTLRFATDHSEIARFTRFEQDLLTSAGVIEVKGQGRSFSGNPAEFPYESQIVDTVESWDGKEAQPFAYIFLSNVTQGCLVLPTKSRPRWRVETKFDRLKRRNIDFYVAQAGELRSMESLRAHLVAHDEGRTALSSDATPAW